MFLQSLIRDVTFNFSSIFNCLLWCEQFSNKNCAVEFKSCIRRDIFFGYNLIIYKQFAKIEAYLTKYTEYKSILLIDFKNVLIDCLKCVLLLCLFFGFLKEIILSNIFNGAKNLNFKLLLRITHLWFIHKYLLLYFFENFRTRKRLILLVNAKQKIFHLLLIFALIIVWILYAGTLVSYWTTAPSFHKRRSFSNLLAVIYFFLATLTLTARCYALKNVTHPLVQLSFHPQFLSSIKHSKFHTYSSNIVLSKFFSLPKENVHRDTSVIIKNFKYLLFIKNFNLDEITNFKHYFRFKRKLDISKLNNIAVDNYISVHDAEQTKNSNYNIRSSVLNSENSVKYESIAYSRHSIIPKNYKVRISKRSNLNEDINLVNLLPAPHSQLKHNLYTETLKKSETSDSQFNKTLQYSQLNSDQRLVQSLKEENLSTKNDRHMPPAFDNKSLSSETAIVVLVIAALVLTVALGLVTCVLSNYREDTAADPHDAEQTPTTAPMLSVVSAGAAAGMGGMDRLRARELASTRDRQIRIHSLHKDVELDLPPQISLPDGEHHRFCKSRLHIRDPEQESEIYRKCIKPPPNRSVLESESPPPYRSNSAGLLASLGSSSSNSNDWYGGTVPLVTRCNSMSSTSKRPEAVNNGQKTDFIQRTVKIFTSKKSQPSAAPTLPVVLVPTRSRHISSDEENSSTCNKPSV